MDKVTRCPKCGKRTIATQIKGRTELTCIRCDPVDPLKTELAKWADSSVAPPK
jgi:phage FluMu protein Com